MKIRKCEQANAEGFLAFQLDATRDEALYAAGIERAKGILVCSGSDATNLFVVLSARELNPGLRIVVRCSDQTSETKMLRAGQTMSYCRTRLAACAWQIR